MTFNRLYIVVFMYVISCSDFEFSDDVSGEEVLCLKLLFPT